jgi:hypothetical protein
MKFSWRLHEFVTAHRYLGSSAYAPVIIHLNASNMTSSLLVARLLWRLIETLLLLLQVKAIVVI